MSLYQPNELCLQFEDWEITKYLIEPLKLRFPELGLLDFDNKVEDRLTTGIKSITFYPDRADILKRDFFGVFFEKGKMVAILIYDREFVFIDDSMKEFIGH